MNVRSLFIYYFCIFFLGSMIDSLHAEKAPFKPQVKTDVGITTTSHSLKIHVFCRNEGKESERIKLKMLVYKKGANKNISRIAQVKDLYLKPDQASLPLITEINIKPEDAYEIIVQIFNEQGDLLEERTFRSGGL